MKDTNENPLLPMDDQPAKPVYINEQHNHNCQQFYGPVTGCVFAMPGATVNQYPNGTAQAASSSKNNSVEETQPATRNPQLSSAGDSSECFGQFMQAVYTRYREKNYLCTLNQEK